MKIRAADDLIEPAVTNALQALQLDAEDEAAATLARQYAAAIDNADDPAATLEQLGPKLLAALEALGATPKARAQIMKGTPARGNDSRLAQLRAAR